MKTERTMGGVRKTWQFTIIMTLTSALAIVCPTLSTAEVLFFDGFGDADLNNNGIPLEAADVDINWSSTDTPPGDTIDSYEPPEFPGTIVNEVSTVLDSNDTGLKWFASRGWTGSVPYLAKANIKIMDDTAGMMPDSTHASYPVPSLDTGYAMGWDSKGRGASATAFFGERIALGTEVGDQVKVSFDFRTWLSGPNSNSFTPPRGASLRFGLFQDSDNQLGMTNPFAGAPDPSSGIPTPAVWGEEDGHFRGDFGTVGATEDRGWYTIVDLGRTDEMSSVTPNFTGEAARINEETNDLASGGKFLEGSDNDFVAKPSEVSPGVFDFLALDVTKAYNLALTLERATDESPGDTIKAIYNITEKSSGQSWTFEGTEPIMRDDGMGGMIPDGISSDSWDYFGIRSTTPLETDGDDFDFLIDNFMLERFGAGSDLTCDFNGDDACDIDDVNELVLESEAGTNDPAFDLTGDGTVDVADIQEWLVQASDADPLGRTFLAGDNDLDGEVGGSDFTTLAFNFGNAGDWGQGNYDGTGGVGGSDFTALAFNFGFTSVSAVPEPSSMGLILIGLLFGLARCVRKP